jgi:hypothetical protein
MTALLNSYLGVYQRCKRLRKTIRKQLGLSKPEIKELVTSRRTPRFVGVPNDPQLGD